MSSKLGKGIRLLLVAAMALGALLAVSVPALASAAAVNFSLTPSSQTVTIPSGATQSAPFTVTIHLDVIGGQQLSGADAFVNFDQTKLQADSVVLSPASLLTMSMGSLIDNAAGQLQISAGTPLGGTPPSTSFDLAVITMHAIAGTGATPSALSFSTTFPRQTDAAFTGNDVTGTLTPAAVTVMVAPTASFTVNTTTPAAGDTVTFTDTSSGPPASWSWNFGDGTAPATVQNPTHVYTVAGPHTVTLAATNSVGSNTTAPGTVITVAPGPINSITVSPASPSIVVAGSQTFTATTYDQYNNQRSGDTIAWSVATPAAGSINASTGALTAGTVAGSYPNAIVATSGAVTGTATVTLTAAALDHITVTPGSQSLTVNGTQAFTAATFDQYDNPRTGDPIAWSVATATAGSINASTGAFTAGTVAGTYTNAIAATSGAKTGTATVIVTPGALASITVSPANPSIVVAGAQSFTASTYDQYGNQRSGDTIAWSVSGSAGSINPTTGAFTAGTVTGTYAGSIVATSGLITGNTSVTLTPGALTTITVSPANPTVGITNTQAFTAVGYDQYGNARTGGSGPLDTFTWSVDPASAAAGTIDPGTGLFTATSNLANVAEYNNAIVATSGAITGTASVNVVAGIINGTVTLQGGSRPVSARAVGVTVKLFTPGTSITNLRSGSGALYSPFTATTANTLGTNTVTFTIVGLAPGTYDVTIASNTTLMNVKQSLTIVPGANAVNFGTLLEGNCNNDPVVNAIDFSTLAGTYLKATGQVGFNAQADFDGNGIVNGLDFSLLAANYLKTAPQVVP